MEPVRRTRLKSNPDQPGDRHLAGASSPDFDAATEAAALRTQTCTLRKRQYCRRLSRLDVYTSELLALHAAGASVVELQRWLRERRIRVVHSTVARWLARNG